MVQRNKNLQSAARNRQKATGELYTEALAQVKIQQDYQTRVNNLVNRIESVSESWKPFAGELVGWEWLTREMLCWFPEGRNFQLERDEELFITLADTYTADTLYVLEHPLGEADVFFVVPEGYGEVQNDTENPDYEISSRVSREGKTLEEFKSEIAEVAIGVVERFKVKYQQAIVDQAVKSTMAFQKETFGATEPEIIVRAHVEQYLDTDRKGVEASWEVAMRNTLKGWEWGAVDSTQFGQVAWAPDGLYPDCEDGSEGDEMDVERSIFITDRELEDGLALPESLFGTRSVTFYPGDSNTKLAEVSNEGKTMEAFTKEVAEVARKLMDDVLRNVEQGTKVVLDSDTWMFKTVQK